jgi:hypothetical protein
MTSTDIAAWWGAFIATFVLVWDIVKWMRTGPRLRPRIRFNIGYPDGRVIKTAPTATGGTMQELAEYCHIELYNNGDRPTTIISIEATHLTGKDSGQLISSSRRFQAHFGKQLPALLGPGEIWSARLEMEDVYSLAERGQPVLIVQTSHLSKAMTIPLKISPKESSENTL